MTKASFKISTNIQLHNLYKTSAYKYWPNSSLKIFPEFQLQNIPNLVLKVQTKLLNFSFQIWNKLLPTQSTSSTSATQQVLSWHPHTPGSQQSSLLNGSESVSDKHCQWSDSGPIKRMFPTLSLFSAENEKAKERVVETPQSRRWAEGGSKYPAANEILVHSLYTIIHVLNQCFFGSHVYFVQI